MKKEPKDDEMRMPSEEFDRIMRKAFQAPRTTAEPKAKRTKKAKPKPKKK